MFMALAPYFAMSISAWSLLAFTDFGFECLLLYHGSVIFIICLYMCKNSEFFGVSVFAQPSFLDNVVIPIVITGFYYLLTSASPHLIAASPMELGPRIFSCLIMWNFVVNGVMIYFGLTSLENHLFLDVTNGLIGYFTATFMMAIGLCLFFGNVKDTFKASLFWRRKSGQKQMAERWEDTKVWEQALCCKDHERFYIIMVLHPLYLPFDLIVPWLCEDLVRKYENKESERPEWLNDGKFIKRMVTIFSWRGKNEEEVNNALHRLFGGCGGGLEMGVDRQLTYIKKNNSLVGRISGMGSKNEVEPI